MRPEPDAGFTLLEVIVAFVISALAVALLYQGTTGGLAATASASRTNEAVLLARSHLAAIGHGDAIAQQESSGVDGDGYSWHLHIRPIASREMNLSDSDRANDTKPTNAVLYDILVTETWQDGPRTRQVSLGTHRFDLRTAFGEMTLEVARYLGDAEVAFAVGGGLVTEGVQFVREFCAVRSPQGHLPLVQRLGFQCPVSAISPRCDIEHKGMRVQLRIGLAARAVQVGRDDRPRTLARQLAKAGALVARSRRGPVAG